MALESSLILDIDKVFKNNSSTEPIPEGKDGDVISWKCHELLGRGSMSRMRLKDGLFLGWGDFQMFENIGIKESTDAEISDIPLIFHFFPPCHGSYSFHCLDSQFEPHLGMPGFGSLLYHGQGIKGIYQCTRKLPVRCVTLFVDPKLLYPFMEGQYDSFPAGLCDIADGDREHFFNRVFTLTPESHTAINQLMTCPYQGTFRRFYFEAKALELLTCAMVSLAKTESRYKTFTSLNADDIARVREIRTILLNTRNKPPSLGMLAKSTGTNKNKLNNDFRKAFGTSIFDFFRITRLEHAKKLLERKRMSVTQVAIELGYSQPQNFTRAFKHHFGTTPADHLH